MDCEMDFPPDWLERTVPGRSKPDTNGVEAARAVAVEVQLCIPADQEQFAPRKRRFPARIPSQLPLPRQGEIVFLSANSAWGVQLVIHQWDAPDRLRIEVWLEHVGTSRQTRPSGFSLTQ